MKGMKEKFIKTLKKFTAIPENEILFEKKFKDKTVYYLLNGSISFYAEFYEKNNEDQNDFSSIEIKTGAETKTPIRESWIKQFNDYVQNATEDFDLKEEDFYYLSNNVYLLLKMFFYEKNIKKTIKAGVLNNLHFLVLNFERTNKFSITIIAPLQKEKINTLFEKDREKKKLRAEKNKKLLYNTEEKMNFLKKLGQEACKKSFCPNLAYRINDNLYEHYGISSSMIVKIETKEKLIPFEYNNDFNSIEFYEPKNKFLELSVNPLLEQTLQFYKSSFTEINLDTFPEFVKESSSRMVKFFINYMKKFSSKYTIKFFGENLDNKLIYIYKVILEIEGDVYTVIFSLPKNK